MADLLSSKVFSIRKRSSLLFYLLPFAFTFIFCINLKAQDDMPDNIAPPSVKVIPKEEKSALDGTSDVKDHTRLALDLMEVRLKKAEALNTSESYGDVLNELGTFQALMDDTLKFLNRNDSGRGKVMDTFKRFEMALRSFTPRIEMIRREVPDRFEYYVRKLLKTVRDTRTKAVEPLFSSTVVTQKDN